MGLKKRSVTFATNIYSRTVKAIAPKGLQKINTYSLLSGRVLETVYLIALFGLAAGVVNAMLEGSKPNYIYALILQSRSIQTLGETAFNFLAIVLGTIGVYLMYQGGRQGIRRRAADLYIGLGILVVLLAVFAGLAIIAAKGL